MPVVASPLAGDLVLLRQSPQTRRGDDAPLPPRTIDRSGDPGANDNFKLSLNSLQLGESFDTIKLDVGLLAWHIGRFPAEVGNSGTKVSDDELCAMLELSQNIGNSIDKIFALRNQNDNDASCLTVSSDEEGSEHSHTRQTNHHGDHQSHKSRGLKRRRRDSAAYPGTNHHHGRVPKRRKMLICSTCLTENTPKWRNGPAGPSTLCNVCGLVYAKRRGRHEAKADRRSKSIC